MQFIVLTPHAHPDKYFAHIKPTEEAAIEFYNRLDPATQKLSKIVKK